VTKTGGVYQGTRYEALGIKPKAESSTEEETERGATATPWDTGSESEGEPELYLLLARWKAGLEKPVEMTLGGMPENATDDMRRLADRIRLLLGLRRSAGEERPLPLSERFTAEQMDWGPNRRRARRALTALCQAGVICPGEPLPPRRGQKPGTNTYDAPLLASAGAVEGAPVEVEAVGPFEPEDHAADDGVVGGAVLAERLDPSVASGDGAGGAHATDGSGETGGSDPDVGHAERVAARWARLEESWSRDD
jgi:hypothetical protein